MNIQVYNGQLPLDALRALLAHVWPDHVSFALVEKVDDLQLLGVRQDAAPDPAGWPQGRAFGPDLEVRWEQRGDVYHVVLADVTGSVPSDGLKQVVEDWMRSAPQNYSYYLWHRDDMRMGRYLNTQRLGISGRAMLDVAEYADAAGVLRFHRYVGIQAERAEEGEDEPV
jgi:hypothetical protein